MNTEVHQTIIQLPESSLFLCDRTSAYGERPCDEAFQVMIMFVDTRTVDDPKKVPASNGKDTWWYREGANHRIEEGRIKRDFPRVEWAVRIDNIMDFIKKYGKCVIAVTEAGYNTIEIYDSYR